MRALSVRTLGIRAFRNLIGVELEFGPRLNVLSGDNGQGKTNTLEALYVLATSRSFRTSRLVDLVPVGTETASLRGEILESGEKREQTIGLRKGLRAVRVEGKRPPTLAAYAVQTPMVVFHSGALGLASGGGKERRRLLDRIALYESPASLGETEAYVKALWSRQRVLEARGTGAADLDGWEELISRHGVAISEGRAAAAARLHPEVRSAFARLGPAGLDLGMTYRRGSPASMDEFRLELARSRGRDRARRSTSAGPHRDDLLLSLSGKPVREMASQGQQRALVLALELAEISVIGSIRGVVPILLMDDVSSELDRRVTAALFSVLRSARGQVFLTTTRPELIDSSGCLGGQDRLDFRVAGGRIGRA